MKNVKILRNVLCVAFLAGCSATWATEYDAPIEASVSRDWNVRSVSVIVPEALSVSEKNGYSPEADIVWRGDPTGDRKLQVAAVVEEGITRGSSSLNGRTPVNLQVVLNEFHALSQRARQSAPSAVHNISYTIQVLDARTGQPLTEPVLFRADLEALTGPEAWEAIEQGETQKVRITRHLQNVTAGWLGTGPDVRQQFSSLGR